MPAESVPCANCGAPAPVAGGYCGGCGTALGTRLCANGHVMDAAWEQCRYCSAEPAPAAGVPADEDRRVVAGSPSRPAAGFGSRAGLLEEPPEETPVAEQSPPPAPEPPAAGGSGPRRPKPRAAPRQRTVYDPGAAQEAAAPVGASPPPAVGAPRLVGWLVTFSLDPSGVDFRLREGRNVVGADPDCDVVIDGDRGISGKHAVVMYRRDRIQIRDNDSTNGTYVNDRDIFGQGAVDVDAGDRIRLGQVELTLHLL